MSKPNFFVGYPEGWISKRPWLHEDTKALYDNLELVLREGGFSYTKGRIKTAPKGYDITLAHHSTFDRRNVWNLKKGYLPGYIYWDRTGYSGWAEMANSETLFQESQLVDIGTARQFFDAFAKKYIASGTSKFPQVKMKGRDTPIKPASGPFEAPNRYVFVACQRPRDTVSKLARIRTEDLPVKVVHAFKNSGYKVVIKRHPQEKLMEGITRLAKEPHVMFSQHSIHQIIPKATAVFTVNSGVGFEALLHKKPVYTSGHCDYHWVTRPVHNDKQLKAAVKTVNQPIDEDMIIKFMYYMLNDYFVVAANKESVKRKVNMCIRNWRGE